MKVRLERDTSAGGLSRPVPIHATRSLPFFCTPGSVISHRVRRLTIYRDFAGDGSPVYSHTSVHCWCGYCSFASSTQKPRKHRRGMLVEMPERPVCPACEVRATNAGQSPSCALAGRDVEFHQPHRRRRGLAAPAGG